MKRPLRILFFSKTCCVHDCRFLSKLSQTGHEVAFLRLHDSPGSPPVPKGIQIFERPLSHAPISHPEECLNLMPSFMEALNSFNPDILHAGPIPNCGFIAAKSGFRPLISMSWAYDILSDAANDSDCRQAASFTIRNSDHFVCDCKAVMEAALLLSGLTSIKSSCFPWGVDLSLFKPSQNPSRIRGSLDWSGKKVVISTRNWEPSYGISTVLQSFRLLSSRLHDARMILLGHGSLEPEIRSFIASSNLESSIHIPADRITNSSMPDYLRSADIYLTASESDGSSISLLEALACGLPVVASDIPGNREWISVPDNGEIAPVGDISAFADSMERLLLYSKENLSAISAANLTLAKARADWDKNFSLLLPVYSSLANME